MAYINDVLSKYNDSTELKQRIDKLTVEIGTCIGKMHANNLIHGDLTTSNNLLDPLDTHDGMFRDSKLIMIDFGLSSFN